MYKLFSIAIDGPSGAGKSTIARKIAQDTGALYLDTGAMYRAVGLWLLSRGIDVRDADAISEVIDRIEVDVRHVDSEQKIYLEGADVTDAIRMPEVSSAASISSAVPAVRRRLVAMQQGIARGRSVVMDGRDIGTKVLPDATLKIFLTASPETRANRRLLELRQKGLPDTYAQVLEAMRIRDHDDSTRAASPLCKADDAIEVDTSSWTIHQAVDHVTNLLDEKLRGDKA